jgi:hypothetical protein
MSFKTRERRSETAATARFFHTFKPSGRMRHAGDQHLSLPADFGTFGPFKGNIVEERATKGLAGGNTGLNLEAGNIIERRRIKQCESNSKLRRVFLR